MTSDKCGAQPLSSGGAVPVRPTSLRDAFEILDDLMSVVEVLCPIWPQRVIFSDTVDFRI